MTLGDGGVTTGASNDIERATEIAYNMVTRWGYSKSLGATLYAVKDGGQGFSGNSQRPVSEETRKLIDAEVTRITKECYEKAEKILTQNKDKLELMMEALMKYETIDRQQIEEIMNEGKEPHEPQNWHDDDNDNDSGKSAVRYDEEFDLSLDDQDLKPKST
jgi:cell division protease FtsH